MDMNMDVDMDMAMDMDIGNECGYGFVYHASF